VEYTVFWAGLGLLALPLPHPQLPRLAKHQDFWVALLIVFVGRTTPGGGQHLALALDDSNIVIACGSWGCAPLCGCEATMCVQMYVPIHYGGGLLLYYLKGMGPLLPPGVASSDEGASGAAGV
jgi:hypothetical protein